MNENLITELNKNFHEIKTMKEKINKLEYKSYNIIKSHVTEEEKIDIINYIYWNILELSSKKIAEDVFNITVSEAMKLIKPFTTNITCIKCNDVLIVKSRSQLNEYRLRIYGRRQEVYTCEKCLAEDRKKFHNKQEKEAKQRKNNVKYLKQLPYSEYLKSNHWEYMRKRMLIRASYKCQICNSSEFLNVHHRTYENKGDENYEDLVVLCNDCHRLYHNK